MTLLVPKKRLGGPIPPREMMRPQAPANADVYEDLDFGIDGGDYEVDEEEGPPYEPEANTGVIGTSAGMPALASPSPKKPLKRALVQTPSAKDSSLTIPEVNQPKATAGATVSERSQLSCQLSRDLHRRLKIYSIVSGRSILAVVEGWIEEHCPPL